MKRVILVVSAALCLGGCGGGGGGVVTSGYTGNTNQATVTSSNAKALSVDIIQGVQNASNVGIPAKATSNSNVTTGQIQSISSFIQENIISAGSKSTLAKTVGDRLQGTIQGITGSCSYVIDINRATGAESGTVTFNQFLPDALSATIMSGSSSFNAQLNVSTNAIISVSMSLSNVVFSTGAQTLTMNGTVSTTNSATSTTQTMSVVQTDSSHNTYWLKDFTVVLSASTVTISGTYYNPLHGYVTIATLTPLTGSASSNDPTGGQMLFTGSNGTKARLTFLPTGYLLEVDGSGLGNFVVVP